MQIKRRATAGTTQSSDLMVVVEPADALLIEIESTVKKHVNNIFRKLGISSRWELVKLTGGILPKE